MLTKIDLGTICLFFFVSGLAFGLWIGWVELGSKNRKIGKLRFELQKLRNRRP